MADTTFVNGTVIEPAWLNDVNDTVYNFTQDGTGAVARSASDKAKDFVSVKDFGAVGNGTTDDTTKIQAAIDSGAGTIYFPAGTYRTTDTILLDNVGQTLIGAGRNSTTIAADFRGGAVIEVNQARCSIRDMAISTLAGSSRRSASPLGRTAPDAAVDGKSLDRGIYLNEVGLLTYTNIERVDIAYQPGDGLNMAGAGSGTVISQVGVTYCGGHGMYFDDGDRDGTPKTRNGIVEIRDCVIQQCWGHGVSLAADSAVTTTVFRYHLHNLDIFDVCLGDGGTNQPAFYTTLKSAIAIRGQQIRVTQCGLKADYGIVMGSSVGVTVENTRFVECSLYGLRVNTGCSRVRITDPYFTSAPTNAGFRVDTSCDNVIVDGVLASELSGSVAIIDAESETVLRVDGKRCLTIAGSSLLWYDEEIKSATISSGICNVQSRIVQMIGEGDVADSVNQIRFAVGVNIPDRYQFTICNFNSYNLTLQDLTVGGSANLQLSGTNAVLEPGESLHFIVRSNVCYAIGREIP